MKKGCFVAFILLLWLITFSSGQSLFVTDSLESQKTYKHLIPELTVDRPDQTDSPYIIPVGFFQVETGVQHHWDHYELDDIDYFYRSLTYPNLLLRYGAWKGLEFRIEGNYGIDHLKAQTRNEMSKNTGLYPVLIAAKIKLYEQKGLIPNLAILVKLYTPFHTRKELRLPYKFAPGLAGAFSHSFSDRFVLDGSAGGFIDQTTGLLITHYSLSQAIGLTEKLSMFVEVFGTKPAHESAQYGMDTGLLYMMLPHMQLDIFVGKSISYQTIDLFIGTGIGIRLPL